MGRTDETMKGAGLPGTGSLVEDLRAEMHEYLATSSPRDREERLALMGAWRAGARAVIEELSSRLGNAIERGGLGL